MFHEVSVLGFNLYTIFMFLGILAGLIVVRVYLGKGDMCASHLNFFLFLSAATIGVSVLSGILFQSLYNYLESGVFKFEGVTFMGGLIGGAAFFLVGILLFKKRVFREPEFEDSIKTMLSCAPCAITLGHALGRLGCLFSGCCYGVETHGFWGVVTPYEDFTVLPVQLFESLFLFALFAALSIFYFKKKDFNLPLYLIAYGVWRFSIEFFRGDPRGETFISFLSPSQATSVLAVLLGVAAMIYKVRQIRRKN